jgi:hypothetical protein
MLLTPEIRTFPRKSILNTLKLFHERNLKVIVEIGCIRRPLTHSLDQEILDCCMDGHSTIYWAMATAYDYFTTVDIEPLHINIAKSEVRKHAGKDLKTFITDGVGYLRNRTEMIDLLFLDFCDADLPQSPQLHLEAYEHAKKNLHENSLILIDDTDCELIGKELHYCDNGVGGKGKLLIPKAIEGGWKVVFSGRQTLLTK